MSVGSSGQGQAWPWLNKCSFKSRVQPETEHVIKLVYARFLLDKMALFLFDFFLSLTLYIFLESSKKKEKPKLPNIILVTFGNIFLQSTNTTKTNKAVIPPNYFAQTTSNAFVR